jgi:ribose transport system substrate-binding protein
MSKKIIALCLAAGLILFAASCRKSNDDGDQGQKSYKGKIGVTCMDLTNPFFKLISNIMTEEAAKHGYKVVSLSGDVDPAKQNNQLVDFAAQGYDAVFINPVDSTSVSQGIKKLAEAGIPVFSYDVTVAGDAGKLIISHIGSDNYQGGLLAGESMIKVTGDKGKIAIISLPEISSCQLRTKGFHDYLKKHNSKLQVVTELSGKGNRSDSYNVATDILQSHPDIVGIFAVNDPSALGAVSAIVKAGRQKDITIVGFDASPAGKQAVYEKKIFDTPQQFPRKMAKGTVDAFIAYLKGENIEKTIFIPCEHYYYEDSTNDQSRISEQW